MNIKKGYNIKILNKGLRASIENRENDSKKRIKEAINSLKNKGLEITPTSIHKESNISRPTIYKYKNFIEEISSIKLINNTYEKESKQKIKDLKIIIDKQKDLINKLKIQNKNLIEQLIFIKK